MIATVGCEMTENAAPDTVAFGRGHVLPSEDVSVVLIRTQSPSTSHIQSGQGRGVSIFF